MLISQPESYPEHFEQLHYQGSVRVIKDRWLGPLTIEDEDVYIINIYVYIFIIYTYILNIYTYI